MTPKHLGICDEVKSLLYGSLAGCTPGQILEDWQLQSGTYLSTGAKRQVLEKIERDCYPNRTSQNMNKPLSYYLTGSAADRLAGEYGEFLEHLTKGEKLAMINVLSGVLHELEINPLESYSTAEYLDSQGVALPISPAFRETLTQLDEYDFDTIATVLMVLAIAVTEQR